MSSEWKRFLADDSDETQWLERFLELTDAERAAWLEQLQAADAARWEPLLRNSARTLTAAPLDADCPPDVWANAVSGAYRRLPDDSSLRYWLLLILNRNDSAEELETLAELLGNQPPQDPNVVAAVISRLMQRPPAEPQRLFPRLLDGLAHRQVAAAVLDLANYYVRRGLLAEHPAAESREALGRLLATLVSEMKAITYQAPEKPIPSEQINESVALCVALCESLGRVAGPKQLDALRAASELTHRRIRVAAAAGLARHGDDDGKQTLLKMAAEPVARLQALQWAEELGFRDQVADEHRTPEAIAESQLAFWLSQPTQFGMPPTRMEKVAERQLHWPGFDQPQRFWLWRFEYQVGDSRFANRAISGGSTQAVAADLSELSVDDCFALFAGFDIEHEEVYVTTAANWSAGHEREAGRLGAMIRAAGYEDFQPQLLSSFFGETSVAGPAAYQGRAVVVVSNGRELLARPRGNPQRPLTADDMVALQRGQAVLQTFNREES